MEEKKANSRAHIAESNPFIVVFHRYVSPVFCIYAREEERSCTAEYCPSSVDLSSACPLAFDNVSIILESNALHLHSDEHISPLL